MKNKTIEKRYIWGDDGKLKLYTEIYKYGESGWVFKFSLLKETKHLSKTERIRLYKVLPYNNFNKSMIQLLGLMSDDIYKSFIETNWDNWAMDYRL